MTVDVTNCKIVVLCGGWSDEREISISSGRACKKALEHAGFSTVELLDVADDNFIEELRAAQPDVAYIAMHGAYGEDGCIQGLLEILHIPYTFSGVTASAMAADKSLAKLAYAAHGIPCAAGAEISASDKLSEVDLDALVERLGLPIFVKPACNGSSYGISKVSDRSQLKGAIELAFSDGGESVLAESFVEGIEISVPVVGNNTPVALPIIQINTGADFYDLKVKYEPSEMHHIIPAQIEPEAYKRAQELAVAAHLALGCRGTSRSDFIVTAAGEPVILETNTIPGMTETSLLPDSARHAGIEFPELCRRFVELALEAPEE